MKNKNLVLFVLLFLLGGELTSASAQGKSGIYKPWSHGRLKVSKENRYLMNADGTPFFWLGDTGWLLPEKLNRDEAAYYLEHCRQAGFNVVQVQTINGVPAMNFYGQYSMIDGFNFKNIDRKGVYGYWDHMDYIIQKAEQNGIYIAMVCIWGGLVRSGKMNVEEAKAYGKFLGERYKDAPNIIWVIGGDTYADRNTEIWEALANSILAVDKNHIMTFHPFGRTSSAAHLNNKEWMDMNMFQSGHRRYGYWSVFAGSCGHTYGHNNIMQFLKPGTPGGYGADGIEKPWYKAMQDPGFNQMKYLKNLMLTFPYFERVPDQSVIAGTNGNRYDRAIATRGKDYLLVYNYSGNPMSVDLTKISGAKKKVWWYSPKDGKLSFIGEFDSKITPFLYDGSYNRDNDQVLIAVDSNKNYISTKWFELPMVNQ